MKEKHNVKNGIFLIFGAVILVAVTVIIVVTIMNGKNQTTNISTGGERGDAYLRGFVEEKNVDTVVSDMKEQVEEGMFECQMSTKWTFADGSSESQNAYVGNSENNRHTFYFDIYMKDTNELLYESPLVPVGSSVTGIKLNKDLPAGDYTLVVQYTLVDDNYDEISSVGFRVKAKVLK